MTEPSTIIKGKTEAVHNAFKEYFGDVVTAQDEVENIIAKEKPGFEELFKEQKYDPNTKERQEIRQRFIDILEKRAINHRNTANMTKFTGIQVYKYSEILA